MAIRRLLVVGIVLLQLLVPALGLLHSDRSARLAWQMFAGPTDRPRVVVLDDRGRRLDRNVRDYLTQYRREVDYLPRLPAHICEVEPRAAVVRVEARTPAHVEVQRC